MRLIGIHGLARTGKDTIGTYMEETYGFHTYAFADPIKMAASSMFGIPIHFFYNDDLKESVLPEWGLSPRYIAQEVGTAGGRDLFREDIWIKRAELEYNGLLSTSPGMVITDLRFPNEEEWIRSMGGEIWHVHAPWVKKVREHVSEQGLKPQPHDSVIENNGTVADLKETVDDLVYAQSDIPLH